MDDVELKSRGYEITLTDVNSGRTITVRLNHDHTKWIVDSAGFSGYYKDLEVAMKEALARARDEMKGEQ